MDALTQAKNLLEGATHAEDRGDQQIATTWAQLAQAAALIALCERLDRVTGIYQYDPESKEFPYIRMCDINNNG